MLRRACRLCPAPLRQPMPAGSAVRGCSSGGSAAGEAGGFAKAFEKFERLQDTTEKKEAAPQPPKSFLTLLRHSKFMQIGDPRGKIIDGKVFQVVGNDIYVDIGFKFPAVITRPASDDARRYVRGAVVRLRLLDTELSTRFLGSIQDMTLLEADAQPKGLLYSPVRATPA